MMNNYAHFKRLKAFLKRRNVNAYGSIQMICTICFLLFSFQLQAQQEITGKVTSNDGPVSGATVTVKGSVISVAADKDGKFHITASKGTTLVISSVGYTTQEVLINDQSPLSVKLISSSNALNEVVVIGYGTQKRTNITGSVSEIKASQFENQPITSASQLLAGKVAGVNINQGSGIAGDDNAAITIRGIGTLNNADPLIIIDGVVATTDNTPQSNAYGSGVPGKSTNPLNAINPSDIESVTVLKDAASASIYGSRAANGVILVTTKRGKKNSSPTVKFNGYYGQTKVTGLPQMLTNTVQFMKLLNQADINSGQTPAFADSTIQKYSSYGDITSTNWVKELFPSKFSPIGQYDMSVSGGNDRTNYFVSLGILDQKAVILSGDYKRYNLRTNLDTKPLDNLTFGTSLTLSRGQQNAPSDDILYVSVLDALRATPILPAFASNGYLALPDSYSLYTSNTVQASNALARSYGNQVLATTQSFLGSAYMDWGIIPGLHLKATLTAGVNPYDRTGWTSDLVGYNWNYQANLANGIPLNNLTGSVSTSSLVLTHSESTRINPFAQLTYNRSFGKHSFAAMAGYSYEKNKYSYYYTSRRTFSSNDTRVLSAGDPSTQTNGGNASQNALASIFGRLNYSFADKYLFEADVRRDGSSRFGPNSRYGTFPAFSAGWLATKEDFLKDQNVISYLKLRASWGRLGNQYASSDFPYLGLVGFGYNYNFGGTTVGGATQTTLGNPDLSWETTTTTDIGLDVNFFKEHLQITADYYNRVATGILYDTPLPSVTGFTRVTNNLASVQNKGVELSVNYVGTAGNVRYSIGGNIARNNNQVRYINPTLSGNNDRVINDSYALLRGSPVDAIYGLKVIGIFQSQSEIDSSPTQFNGTGPGDLKYEDLNHDGKIDQDDRQVLGNFSPKWTYGFNATVSYAHFTLSALFQGIGDAQAYNQFEYYVPTFQGSNFGTQWLNAWTPENHSTTMPRVWNTSGPNTQYANSFFVQDRSYLRMKNIQLNYEMGRFLKKTFLSNLTVFVSGQNLLTWTKYKGFDPEQAAQIGRSGVPQVKIYTAGLNLTF
ncbi:SusC/RagA family TonB-linked outer membrane protein [Mucilaginibacter sp. SJ]|uniref:SusC/RagA family TonB-linked outer membrane protein n=1 Tax=Mucilaginibacter sp. SJ TaxID=3029053 RepID=UPI0023A922E3|nr:TonB-dependent receptor [Mucilaginibacter sp. SJ]WEA00594.1 TonB-dependent receptor [Mucilaginibacter sp. SJ]